MPEYFKENRFRTIDEHFSRPITDLYPELAEPGSLPTGHKLSDDPEGPRYLPNDGRPDTVGAIGGGLDLFNRGVEGARDLLHDERVADALRDIRYAAREQLPSGREYTLIVTDPGGPSEHVEIQPGATDYSKSGYQAPGTYLINERGQNTVVSQPPSVVYENSAGQRQSAPVAQPHDSFINKEPRDITRDGGIVPADGRLDHDHPMYRDPRGLA